MEKYIITTGKSIELAISNALAELRMDREDVSVEVLENARSGFLGIGASPAKVKVTSETVSISEVLSATLTIWAAVFTRLIAPTLIRSPDL